MRPIFYKTNLLLSKKSNLVFIKQTIQEIKTRKSLTGKVGIEPTTLRLELNILPIKTIFP